MVCSVNGVELYYEVSGRGRPILLVHGNGESHEIFDVVTRDLSKTHQVYAVDSRCHGRSTDTPELHYDDMASDLIAFMKALDLEKPSFYGFSDGGILGLLIAIREPALLGRLIVSGANLWPEGLDDITWQETKLAAEHGSKLDQLMLREPHIPLAQLETITVPTAILAGEYDVIRREHTELIAAHIPGSVLRILPGEGHETYVIHSKKLFPILQTCLESI